MADKVKWAGVIGLIAFAAAPTVLWAQDVPGDAAVQAQWFTGSLEAPSPALPKAGILALEPYMIYTNNTGAYGDGWQHYGTPNDVDSLTSLIVIVVFGGAWPSLSGALAADLTVYGLAYGAVVFVSLLGRPCTPVQGAVIVGALIISALANSFLGAAPPALSAVPRHTLSVVAYFAPFSAVMLGYSSFRLRNLG